MSERYSRLFTLPENLYAVGSPVVIAAGALLKDNQTGKVIAQLKLKNLSNKAIKAATVSVVPFDTVGNPLGDPIQYQYLDIKAFRDENFGSKSPIFLANITTRSFAATVKEIAFEDNTVWTAGEDLWEPLSIPTGIGNGRDVEFVNQFRMEYGPHCKYFPKREKDLWHCTCGALNHEDESLCHSCNESFAAISRYDVDEINEHKKLRLAREKENAEYEAEQRRIRTKLLAQKAKKLAVIAISVVAVFLLITKVIFPEVKYSRADRLAKTGRYEAAIEAYRAIDNSEETSARLATAYHAYAKALLVEGKKEQAAIQFNNADVETHLASKDKVGAYKLLRKMEGGSDAVLRAEQLKREIQQEINIQWVLFNANENDTTSIAEWIPKDTDYLQFSFVAHNPYSAGFNLKFSSQWPGKNKTEPDWTWDDIQGADRCSAVWESGYSARSNGELIIEVFIDGTDIVLDTFTMRVGK